MLGHFPTPYPDELLYSICGRYSDRMPYHNAKSVLEDLFGTPTATAVVDLPDRLGSIAANLPEGTSLTTDHLISRRTLLPFFSAFLPPERVDRLHEDMKRPDGPAAYLRSGLVASRIPQPRFLRYCPACKRDDEKLLGETYWRRLHQLPGVEVCPTHEVFLEDGGVSRLAGRISLRFITAENSTRTVPLRRVNLTDRDHQALLKVARDSAWLLEHPRPGSDLNVLYERYLLLLVKRSLATHTGSIHVGKLLDQFRGNYSALLLNRLHCEFSGKDLIKTNWLLRLMRPPRHAQHPLYHLLSIQFLGQTAEEFFKLPERGSHFGEGPWPCLNPAAEHFREPVIQECSLSPRLRDGRPVGRFNCACGFSYYRAGPDSSHEDRYRIGRVVSFGPAWEAKLKELWEDGGLSLSEVGRLLGVDPLTVRRHATRLNLSPSPCRNTKPLSTRARLKNEDRAEKMRKKRDLFRSKWLSGMKQRSKRTMKSLRKTLPKVYAWLLQHDTEWLKRNRPRPAKNKRGNPSVDWNGRDLTYTALVRQSAARIRNGPGRPVRVTRTAVARDLGVVSLFQKHLHKMPQTSRALASVVESSEEFAVRRVWRASNLYLKEGVRPRRWQVILRANVYRYREDSKVREALQDALQMLNSELPLMRASTA
jgi:Tn7-like transposition protein D/TniQ